MPALRLPVCTQTPEALEAGIFQNEYIGWEGPNKRQTADIVAAWVDQMIQALLQLDALKLALKLGLDPDTGQPSRTSKRRESVKARTERRIAQQETSYPAQLDQFGCAFGLDAADAIDRYVRRAVTHRREATRQLALFA